MEAKPRRRTRERILELSLRLFNEIGEPNVTTTTIADEMAISPGNLYYHFRNKDDIINSLFAQFEGEIEKRMQFSEGRPTIEEVWLYLQHMADFLWTYRFFYRDLNDLLSRNRTLETHFKQIIGHKVRFARSLCEQLVEDGQMLATPDEITVISTNVGVIATYWLSYQFVMNPRQYNDQEAIRKELHQASQQILSIMAPYLKGRSREMFDDLVRRRFTLSMLKADVPEVVTIVAVADKAEDAAVDEEIGKDKSGKKALDIDEDSLSAQNAEQHIPHVATKLAKTPKTIKPIKTAKMEKIPKSSTAKAPRNRLK